MTARRETFPLLVKLMGLSLAAMDHLMANSSLFVLHQGCTAFCH